MTNVEIVDAAEQSYSALQTVDHLSVEDVDTFRLVMLAWPALGRAFRPCMCSTAVFGKADPAYIGGSCKSTYLAIEEQAQLSA